MFVCSSILWDDYRNKKDSNKLKTPDNLNIYYNIVNQYYKAKYNNRKLSISNSNSTIRIKLGNTICKIYCSEKKEEYIELANILKHLST